MDFTLSRYCKLLEDIKKSNHQTCTVRQYLVNHQNLPKKTIVLRHDVDRRPINALKMAQAEAERGIASTYYFRHMRHTFKPDLIQEIAKLGHEIGYHYETLAKTKGHYKNAYELFKIELSDFRAIAQVDTACMHGRPLSRWDNRDLWKKYSFEELGIIGEPYLSIDYKNIIYLTDTGRSWNGGKYNLRDKVSAENNGNRLFVQTDDISDYLPKNEKLIVLQTHPERWAYSNMNYALSFSSDKVVNIIKYSLSMIRG